jgi:orotate phosphoribosyltransferase
METDPSLKRELIHAVEKHALTFGKFTLKSGASSHFYLDCKKLILSPRGLWLVVQMIRNEIDWERYDAVGGPSIGADPIIGGLIYDIGQEVSGDKVR